MPKWWPLWGRPDLTGYTGLEPQSAYLRMRLDFLLDFELNSFMYMVGLAEKSPKRFSILERSASEKGTCTLTTPSTPATSRKGANTVGGCGAGVRASAGHLEWVWAETGDSREPGGGPEGGTGVDY